MARTAAETRELLTETALHLFREEGFEATTMRRIATTAGVSLGNAYHHFDGKDDLVQELYRRIQTEHHDAAAARLSAGGGVDQRLAVVLHAGLDVMAPYHGFGQSFLRIALQTGADASPFSAASAAPRAQAVELMRLVVEGSTTRTSRSLQERLPFLLWLTYLAVTLHWVTDPSPGQHRTRTLVDGLAPLVGRAVALARVPVARGLVDQSIALLDTLTARDHQEP